ncbi:MAG: hypothetical protein AAF593_17150 [Planctomycetota bacterium]
MSVRSALLLGLLLLLTAMLGCGESEPPTANEAGLEPVASTPPVTPGPDWLPPGFPFADGSGMIVVNNEHLAKAQLEAALQRVIATLAFDTQDTAKLEFQHGLIAGMWDAFFLEVSFRQFILADHGVNAFALGVKASPEGDGNLAKTPVIVSVRLDDPRATATALTGLRMVDPAADFKAVQPARHGWSRVTWGPVPAEADEVVDQVKSPTAHAVADRLPPEASVYWILPGPWIQFPIFETSVSDEWSEQAKLDLGRTEELLAQIEFQAHAVRWSPDFRFDLAVAMKDEDAARNVVRFRQDLNSRPPAGTADLGPAGEWLMRIAIEHPLRRDGRYLTLSLGPEDMEPMFAAIEPEMLAAFPAALVLFARQN